MKKRAVVITACAEVRFAYILIPHTSVRLLLRPPQCQNPDIVRLMHLRLA